MKGRKRKEESRAAELRQRLVVWQQTPEPVRPSLRALARELGANHQLLTHYRDGLESWKAREKAKRIRARAEAESREMTMPECIDAIISPRILADIESLRRLARRGPLNSWQIKTLKLWGKHFPLTKEVLASSRAMTPQEEGAERQRLRKARRLNEGVPKISKARFHEIRLQKLVERFEEIGGVILPEGGQVCYFIPQETPLSRALVNELVKYREELKQILELNPGNLDFARIKAEICQRFPTLSLSPLEPHRGKWEEAGNSAGTREKERHAVAVSAVVPQ